MLSAPAAIPATIAATLPPGLAPVDTRHHIWIIVHRAHRAAGVQQSHLRDALDRDSWSFDNSHSPWPEGIFTHTAPTEPDLYRWIQA
jgi:hypothetical protein